MARREKEEEPGFNPFIDILTCLAGIMIFIICLVVVEARDAKVLIPTPELRETNKEPVYIEVNRDGALFYVRVRELSKMAEAKLAELSKEFEGKDQIQLMNAINQADVGDNFYNIELMNTLTGQLALVPKEGVDGLAVTGDLDSKDKSSSWYQRLIVGGELDPERQMLAFLVRSTDPSYTSFKRARALAWIQGIEVAYEVIDTNEMIKFGLGGAVPMPN